MEPGDWITPDLVLNRLLGQGAMGVVWAAHRPSIGDRVAIKFLSAAPHNSDRAAAIIQRFRQEASTTARIASPHVVRVHDSGVTDAVGPYMVMELIEGETLAFRLLRRGPLGVYEAALVLDQLCSVLTAAHAQGLVHRDIKPENLFILKQDDRENPFLKVLDFGLAKDLQATAKASGEEAPVMADRVLLGSPCYMSPEQTYNPQSVSPSYDLWAVGVTVYQLLIGKVPFQGRTQLVLFDCIRRSLFVPPSQHRTDLPPATDAWVERALAPEPAARFDSAAQMSEAFWKAIGQPAPRRGAMPYSEG